MLRIEEMVDSPVSRLRRGPALPILGAVLGAAAGYAYYVFFGCDSG